ncbi:unnamed protein product [Linum tenue]|uniref:PROP1-like PPR domain-containing protein n=2 Tax=Linum tenue TaxID=586396 RepID=A0AAV0ITQ8_9ROSI|nr:unnamed protein product [Linum tenue]
MATTILQFPNPIRSPYLKPEDSPCGQVLGKAFSETFRGSVRSNGKRRTQSLVTANHQKPDEQVATEGETVRSKWREIGPNITKLQRQAISELPPVMTNRCKAVMKQIICFSDDKGGLRDLLSAWARIMNPRRADWLSVLKQLKDTEHPFYVQQVAEFALLEESFEANTRDYTKLIHFYGKQKQLEDAERSFSCMKERGLLYDQITLTAMIHMYSKAGHHKKAEQIFEELLLLGQPLDQRSYGSMVMSYIRAGMLQEAESLLKQMDDQEVTAGREVYKALLRTFSMTGDVEGAQRVFDAMQIAGIVPDARVCALLLNAYEMAGESQLVRVAFENMRGAGVKLNDKCVALVLAAYEKEEKLDKALEFLVGLEKDGVLAGKEASAVLAGWFGRLGVVKEVEVVLSDLHPNKLI